MKDIKHILLFILVSGFAGLPATGQDSKQYDENISKLVGKIQQYPGRTKYCDELKENYVMANTSDQDRIMELKLTGQPDIWYDIYLAYESMDSRQTMIMKLPENTVRQMGMEITDYKNDTDESRYKAMAYLYAHSEKLLESDNPEDARKAYIELIKVARLNNSYKDLDKLIRKAVLKGATNVEFEMHNRTHKAISTSLVDRLTIIIWEFKKASYGQAKPDKADNNFAFTLRVVLDDLKIGPDLVKDVEYQEERDIYRDGLVVDTIKCLIQESRQLKKAQLAGSLEYLDKQTGRVVNRIPIRVESVFSNACATLQGNPDAAGDATKELLKAKKAAFPSDEQMILDATEEFTKKATEIILAE